MGKEERTVVRWLVAGAIVFVAGGCGGEAPAPEAPLTMVPVETTRVGEASVASGPDPTRTPTTARSADTSNSALANRQPLPGAGAKVASLRPAFQACWNEEIVRDVNVMSAKLRLTLTIAPTGDVTAVAVDGYTEGPLFTCIVAAVQSSKFEPFSQTSTIVVPISFARYP